MLGKHKAAIDVYEEAATIDSEDWEIWHNKGLCYMYLKQYKESIKCFQSANSIQRHDSTFMQLGKVYTMQEEYKSAIDVYMEALEFSPENPGMYHSHSASCFVLIRSSELLTTLGLLYLRLGENYRAFEFLGNSLTHDPKNPKVRATTPPRTE